MPVPHFKPRKGALVGDSESWIYVLKSGLKLSVGRHLVLLRNLKSKILLLTSSRTAELRKCAVLGVLCWGVL